MKLYFEYFSCLRRSGKGLLFFFLSVISFLSYAAVSPYTQEASRIIEESRNALGRRDYGLLKNKGDQLKQLGKIHSNINEETVGNAIMLYSLICIRDTTDFSSHIESLIKYAPVIKENDTKGYGIVAITLSSYYQKILNDFPNALHYATESLNAFRTSGSISGEVYALSSIASIYFQKHDPTSWSYAIEAYNKAKKLPDLGPSYVTACNMANYLYNKGEYEEAMSYLTEGIEIAKKGNMDSEESYLNSFLGDLYNKLGNKTKAEEYFKLSLANNDGSSNYDIIYSGFCYADFLMNQNRFDEALVLLSEVENIAKDKKIIIFNGQIYSLLSKIYEIKGDYQKSLEYNRLYTNETLNSITEQKEREFAILDLRNRISEEENKNALQSVELLKRGRVIIILSAIGALILVVFLSVFIYVRFKMKNYKDTVERFIENSKHEKILRQQLEEANAALKESQRNGGLKEAKSYELFNELERMMREKKLYHELALTLDKTASILGTNRTYLSQVVNERAGKSFTTYINDFRIDEAIELLSDPDNNEPLKSIGAKVGFSSPSNFYSLFRQRVGVSPSVFRSNIIKT